MCKYAFFFVLLIGGLFSFAQDTAFQNHGTLKITKQKKDSVYIKAEMIFQQFQEGNKSKTKFQTALTDNIHPPLPIVAGNAATFDFTDFFSKNAGVKKSEMSENVSDTVCFQIKILDNGKPYYKDMTPLLMLNGVPAYYNKQMNAYKLDPIHLKCMSTLKEISEWKPAYIATESVEKFKRQTVIKQKRKYLSATGVLTIMFSKVPFED